MLIKLSEKKESLESIILGLNRDPLRVNFHEFLKVLDHEIETASLSDESLFSVVMDIDGQVFNYETYPDEIELAAILGVDVAIFAGVNKETGLLNAANTTRIGNCCGVGEDIYLDPNEEN